MGFSQNVEETQVEKLPEINKFINDYEDILTFSQEQILNASAQSFEEESRIGIVIVTVDTILPYKNIFDYSLALAKKSKFGCVFIVVCKSLREIQIQNCDEILQKLTNEETKLIIDNYILPDFKKGKYYKGLLNGLSEIKKELK